MIKKLALFAAALTVTVPAFAEHSVSLPAAVEDFNTRQIKVNFADLNVSDAHGAAALYARTWAAARSVCAPLDERGLAEISSVHACVYRPWLLLVIRARLSFAEIYCCSAGTSGPRPPYHGPTLPDCL
jgi:UrcA family protein